MYRCEASILQSNYFFVLGFTRIWVTQGLICVCLALQICWIIHRCTVNIDRYTWMKTLKIINWYAQPVLIPIFTADMSSVIMHSIWSQNYDVLFVWSSFDYGITVEWRSNLMASLGDKLTSFEPWRMFINLLPYGRHPIVYLS